MVFEITIDGRQWTIGVEARGGKLAVECEGRLIQVDAASVAGGLSLIFPDDGLASREAMVREGSRSGELVIDVDGAAFRAAVQPAGRWSLGPRTVKATNAHGRQRIVAPMPGRIVRVLVHAGDRVEPRQSLVVIEAMKMENELRSSAAGVVVAVEAVEGATVDAGTVLVIVE